MASNDVRVGVADQALVFDQAASRLAPTGFDPSRDREFRRRICAAAVKIAHAEFYSGPLHGNNMVEHLREIGLKQRADDAALSAVIEVVLFVKVHGEAIVRGRDSDTHPTGGDGTAPFMGSAGRETASPNPPAQGGQSDPS